MIKKVKESVSIPVIANGDIRSGRDAKKALEQSNVDAIMVRKSISWESLDF